MCGRYRLSRRKEALIEHFGVDEADLDWEPRYNIAPTQPVPVIRGTADGSLRSTLMRWGLVPAWAKDPGFNAQTINARAETAASKPSFRDPLRNQRCLIPADGFYEWQKTSTTKQPFCFEVDQGGLFAFAGLWDRWHGPGAATLESCVILTTTPNRLLADVHDRMPAILRPEQYSEWLNPSLQDPARVIALVKPLDADHMRRYPVSTRVNHTGNEGPECCSPADLMPENLSLFG